MVRNLAFSQGSLLLVIGLLRCGFLVRFFSRPILAGYLLAASLLICGTQLQLFLFNDRAFIIDNVVLIKMFDHLRGRIAHAHAPTVACACAFALLLAALRHFGPTRNIYSLLMVAVSTLTGFVLSSKWPSTALYYTGAVEAVYHVPDLLCVFSPYPATGSMWQQISWPQVCVCVWGGGGLCG
jgi:MFS superfamily sulfate permease-like transporter